MAKSITGEEENAVRELVEEGISADEKIRSYNIIYDREKVDLSKQYMEEIKKLPQKNLKVELAYKLLDDAIKTKFKSNIVKQKSFQERIEQSLSRYHAKFEDYETVMKR